MLVICFWPLLVIRFWPFLRLPSRCPLQEIRHQQLAHIVGEPWQSDRDRDHVTVSYVNNLSTSSVNRDRVTVIVTMWRYPWPCDNNCDYVTVIMKITVTVIVTMWQWLWLCDSHHKKSQWPWSWPCDNDCDYVTAIIKNHSDRDRDHVTMIVTMWWP